MKEVVNESLRVGVERAYAFALRTLLKVVPRRARLRIARNVYNFDYSSVRGFHAVLPYCDGLRFKLNTKEVIGWRIFFSGEYEPCTNAAIRAVCRPGDMVIDAGANNGSETLLAALLVGAKGRVYAFEPVPHVNGQLADNVRLNRLENIVSLETVALGPDERAVSFFLMPDSVPNQGMSSQFRYSGCSETLQVRQRSLDNWAAECKLERLDLLKMDIQGGELGLLEGGRATISHHLPAIIAEAGVAEQEQAGRSLRELWAHLNDVKYDVWCFGTRGLTATRIRGDGSLPEGLWLGVARQKRELIDRLRAECLIAN